ncbi:MAG: methyl-accepting chemotaxis protein [Humidesulfovibrio sp.]|uniref:methyl-accepting chemotaxis protein n=1 Tax=Humidesulfovibrio sp. TaxID=2910988 RepID=UPI0027E72844|nr:methyl-accepting chemotaxis protein [Humidesulfovibrio sp.]MDQ7835266.1 methyl-accepting chemotaxis protein [Humidesulfovibrio sp.]
MKLSERFNTSLTFRILVLTCAVSGVVFLGLFLATSFWQKKAMLSEVKANALRSAQMISMAVEEPMRLGDNKATRERFADLDKQHKTIEVYMVDYKGNITYATQNATERKDAKDVLVHEECNAMIERALKEKYEGGDVMTMNGSRFYTEVKTIANEPECHHCHGKSKPILGAMIMQQDLSEQFSSLYLTQVMTALLSLGGMVALSFVLFSFFKRVVIRRITSIEQSADQVLQGDLNAQFKVPGEDRLARLADHLGVMVGRIKDQLEYSKGLLDGIIVPMYVADKDGNLNYVNAPMRAILGKADDETLGQSVSKVFYNDPSKPSNAKKVLDTGKAASGKLSYTRKDGVTFPLYAEASPLRDAKGGLVGVVCVLVDLTQEEQARTRIEANRQNLLNVANDVTQVALKLEQASHVISGQMEDLTKGMDSAADRTTQMATAMEEMNSTVLEVARNAGETSEASNKANSVAREGGEMVQSTLAEIQHVADTAESLSQALGQLSLSAKDIGQVMSVINDIADQTNLLALNAAIEAARAGDAGRGFAVVADEVRKLAEKTMTATKEVESAIKHIQQSTADAVREMNTAKERVDKTTELAGGAGGVLKQIVDASDHIADMVRSIATAAEQQSATSEEINMNVSEINHLSGQMSQDVQGANDRIREVAEMSKDLAKLVEKFRANE